MTIRKYNPQRYRIPPYDSEFSLQSSQGSNVVEEVGEEVEGPTSKDHDKNGVEKHPIRCPKFASGVNKSILRGFWGCYYFEDGPTKRPISCHVGKCIFATEGVRHIPLVIQDQVDTLKSKGNKALETQEYGVTLIYSNSIGEKALVIQDVETPKSKGEQVLGTQDVETNPYSMGRGRGKTALVIQDVETPKFEGKRALGTEDVETNPSKGRGRGRGKKALVIQDDETPKSKGKRVLGTQDVEINPYSKGRGRGKKVLVIQDAETPNSKGKRALETQDVETNPYSKGRGRGRGRGKKALVNQDVETPKSKGKRALGTRDVETNPYSKGRGRGKKALVIQDAETLKSKGDGKNPLGGQQVEIPKDKGKKPLGNQGVEIPKSKGKGKKPLVTQDVEIPKSKGHGKNPLGTQQIENNPNSNGYGNKNPLETQQIENPNSKGKGKHPLVTQQIENNQKGLNQGFKEGEDGEPSAKRRYKKPPLPRPRVSLDLTLGLPGFEEGNNSSGQTQPYPSSFPTGPTRRYIWFKEYKMGLDLCGGNASRLLEATGGKLENVVTHFQTLTDEELELKIML